MRQSERYPIAPGPVGGAGGGVRTKEVIEKENNFTQPGERYRSWDAARQARFVNRVVGWLADRRVTAELRRIWLGYWAAADAGLARKIEQALGAALSGKL